MISFIIIGRNIEPTIELCLKGVFKFIQEENIPDSEVIYVDSESTDGSVELALKTNARVIRLEGDVNAAVGRNVGAEHARGDILFFLDGDMELLPGFLSQVIDESGKPNYPFCTGFWNEVYYDKDWNPKNSDMADPPKDAQFLPVTGGLMIIEKEKWDAIGGMDERFQRSQDHDFGLRMNKAGTPVKKLPVVMLNHHTISYFDGARLGQFFKSTGIFSQGLLMRKHHLDKAYFKRYFAKSIYALMFLGSFILAFIAPLVGGILLLFYLTIHASRALKSGGSIGQILGTFVFHSLFSAYAGLGFVFYHPGKPVYTVKQLNG